MSRWNDARSLNNRPTYVGGTGSISCLGLTPEEGADAEARRGPLGFSEVRLPGGDIRHLFDESRVDTLDEPTVDGRFDPWFDPWGEALWTARDLLTDLAVKHFDARRRA